jgi:hypothetical protein
MTRIPGLCLGNLQFAFDFATGVHRSCIVIIIERTRPQTEQTLTNQSWSFDEQMIATP